MKGFKGSPGPKGHSGVRGDPVSLSCVFITHFLNYKQPDMISDSWSEYESVFTLQGSPGLDNRTPGLKGERGEAGLPVRGLLENVNRICLR